MAKLGFYKVKKRYKNKVHETEQICLRFPKKTHYLLQGLRDQRLEIKITQEGNEIHIRLTKKSKP